MHLFLKSNFVAKHYKQTTTALLNVIVRNDMRLLIKAKVSLFQITSNSIRIWKRGATNQHQLLTHKITRRLAVENLKPEAQEAAPTSGQTAPCHSWHFPPSTTAGSAARQRSAGVRRPLPA